METSGSPCPTIHYTLTDEAPALATRALFPIIQRFCEPAGVEVSLTDISVASRILAQFGLDKDNLSALGEIAKTPGGNIIKLPNISASVPQLAEAIRELQSQGFKIPDYPTEAKTDEDKAVRAKYGKVLGSAVNPVLREGNSDRRAAKPVKLNAQRNNLPVKSTAWKKGEASKTSVASMMTGDFYESEKSFITPKAQTVRIELTTASGSTTVLKAETKLTDNEVIDASFMSVRKLREFYEEAFQRAKKEDVLVSLHLKATMMKISDPIIFGHAVSVFYKDALDAFKEPLASVNADPNDGLGSILQKAAKLPEGERIIAAINEVYNSRPRVSMVDSAKGVTNFHVPSDVIIDASMPPLIRDGGMMWNKDNKLEDSMCIIPDRCYSGVYATVVEDCKVNGGFNHSTMGHVSNVGLMAKAAEEYGSHDKTFQIPEAGTVRVLAQDGSPIFEHVVEKGDIWRMCQTKDVAIKDWVKLAYTRALASDTPAIFWLDEKRAHDRNIIALVQKYGEEYAKQTSGKGISVTIRNPNAACLESITRARAGKDTISVTGNVLRDYNTDLFPILELGTSAKMLSIVPLLAGGGMYETGAGGSAPKHVQQFVKEGHLRWDSLGEYLALGACLEDLGKKLNAPKILQAGVTLNEAIGQLLDNDKSPGRSVKEIDNRASAFYIALYWATALAKTESSFAALATKLREAETQIVKDMIDCQGPVVDVGGYYRPDETKTRDAMRPSKLFNEILASNCSKL